MAQTKAQTVEGTAPHVSGAPGSDDRRTIEVNNPATGLTIARVPTIGTDGVGELAARARAAQPGWEALGFEGRAKVLKRAQKWTTDNADRIARTIVSETGKTYEDAQIAEISYAAQAFGFWANNAEDYLSDEKIRSTSASVIGRKLFVRYAPVGVVGVIGPWNYPLINSFGDSIPALAAGNSVILKPASLTPLTSLLMEEGLRECGLPEDVLLTAIGPGEVGSELIEHVGFVMFTGSTEVGKKVMERAAKTLTPVGLELGGKDPMVVLSDANLERAANAAVHCSMQNGGQTCISIERAYVEEPVYEQFVALVEKKMRAVRYGVPGDPGVTDVGAVTSPPQVDLIDEHVRDAVDKGAKVLVGGNRGDGPGDFFEPTMLVNVDHTMECMTEETFGPTLPVMKVRDAEEGIRLANDSPYGLQASIWTEDTAKGERLAREVETGVVCVNDAQVNYFALELPMGGWKASGLGSRHGKDGIRKYTKQQTVMIRKFAPTNKDIYMLPYKARNTKLIRGLVKLLYGRGKRD
ncbi:MAG: aldehyde dehydrogenase family protein [Actinomycetota bacterium]|nr:aldehyde dehydrogenase family protein [Actinomycetota bacterium]